jgi:hypothetical protein
LDNTEPDVTDAEWWSFDDPEPMVKLISADHAQRELRLFAAACVRRVWELLPETARVAVEASEQFAEGRIGEPELQQTLSKAEVDCRAAFPGHMAPGARAYAFSAALDASSVWRRTAANVLAATTCAASAAACVAAEVAEDSRYDEVFEAVRRAELAAQAQLLRTLIGNLGG